LLEQETNSQNRLAGTGLPEHDHPPCFLAPEIRADVGEHAGSIARSQPQSRLCPKFKIVDNHVWSSTQLIKKDRFPGTDHYVVVGTGSAGSVVADRLSADPRNQ
jgi:hypothetical protein